MVVLCAVYNACYHVLQDPSEQTAIDNFMVQPLDGTVIEWGWCKQKVQQSLQIIVEYVVYLQIIVCVIHK